MHTTASLTAENKETITKIANTIRQLTIDATQKADSGHPGLPMGCAELGAYLYGFGMRYNPKQPAWFNRDRFILSAGHGSLLLYSLLHLSGYDISLEEIKHFRQWGSKTPGHPEKEVMEGIETTTGPLGQGISNAVGTALGYKMLAARFNTEQHKIITNKIFTLMGDGCVMEGISSEASSLAGHLKLNNLVAIYDSNHVCLDGPLLEACSEDTAMRYRAYGWEVYEIDGYDMDRFHEILSSLKEEQDKPVLIIAHTIIGKGSPNRAGTHNVHGSPLGEEEAEATKENLGLSQDPFFVPKSVEDFFAQKLEKDQKQQQEWDKLFDEWAKANPEKKKLFDTMKEKKMPADLEEELKNFSIPSPTPGRKASNAVINFLAKQLPFLVGGSADLSCSDNTMIKDYPLIAPGVYGGRNIKFGVREFAMATMATGIAQTGMFLPFVGTFLTFSDYMRNGIRLCSMMKEQVIYQFTHDSIFLGEDGPTHQPVEHLAALRAIPNLHVIRPADADEVKMAWIAALKYQGPTALILTRQNLPGLAETKVGYSEGVGKGAYILKKEKSKPDFTLMATGSEVSLAMDVAKELEKLGKQVRVVSMPCWELFEKQSSEYKESILGGDIGKRVSIEAAGDLGWHKYVGLDGITISVDSFGASAPFRVMQKEFGFTVESILERIL